MAFIGEAALSKLLELLLSTYSTHLLQTENGNCDMFTLSEASVFPRLNNAESLVKTQQIWCNGDLETALHAFRDCPLAVEVFDLCECSNRWSKPTGDTVKINVDGAFLAGSGQASIGVIARNKHGVMIDGWAYKLLGAHRTESAEACAFAAGIEMAADNGWP